MTGPDHRFWHRLALLAVLLLAAALRLGGYRLSPPGLSHDEVANWLIDRQILGGQHAVYFTEAYGHEAGFHYLQAGALALLGDHPLALRLPAAFAGILLVAVTYALLRILFGRQVALTAAALLAVLFWPIFFSRQGLRAITLPVTSGLSAIFWWRGWGAERPRQAWFWFGLAGVWAGLSLYTYMAARAVPIFYALFIVYLILFQRDTVREKSAGIFLFVLLYTVLSLPLVTYLQAIPNAEFRISEIDAPLRALRQGDLRPALSNSWKLLGMFGFAGDPLWRQNVAGLPIFDPLTSLLFYAGLALTLWRWRDPRHAFLLLWLGSSALPSIATVDAPSSIRAINGLLVVTAFVALTIHSSDRLSTVLGRLSTAQVAVGRGMAVGALVLLLTAGHGWRTVEALFRQWPANDEVQFVHQTALTEAARYLDSQPQAGSAAIAGWTPESMDPPTMVITLHRQDVRLAYFQPQETLLVPGGALIEGNGVRENAGIFPSRIIRPTILPLHSWLEAQLTAWGAPPDNQGAFTLYQLAAPPQLTPAVPLSITFGHEVQLLGYSLQPGSEKSELLSYWRVLAPATAPRRTFLHAVAADGTVLAQHDGLDAPSAYWQPGDLLLQIHWLPLPPGVTALRLGLYNPLSGQRLPLPAGADAAVLSPNP